MRRASWVAGTGVLAAGLVAAAYSDLGEAVIAPRALTVTDSYVATSRPAPFAPRMAGALGGHEVMARIAQLPTAKREAALLSEIIAGNVPSHLRTLVPVRVATKDHLGRQLTATVWTLPDYLAVGSDQDFVRVPLNLETASKLALYLGMVLPTPKLVDDIYTAASVKLTPQPMPPSREMTSVAAFLKHNDAVERDLAPFVAYTDRSKLVAGHKKDVVLSTRLESRVGRLAIFGWHRPSGKAIQPLSTVHDARYADYSHGIRLVAASVFVDGRDQPIEAALGDRATAQLFSYEGRFKTFGAVLEAAAHGGSRVRTRFMASLGD